MLAAWQVGVLPIALFSNGHAFFVQHHDIHMQLSPYAVHATYTFDGAGSVAKQHRFRERGLWYEDEAYVHAADRFLTYDASVPPELHGPVGALHLLERERPIPRALEPCFGTPAVVKRCKKLRIVTVWHGATENGA